MRVFTLLLFFALPIASFAVEPDEVLQDHVMEARARMISTDLRCVVCQNQDIDSSNAGVARDLRILVRERLMAGDSNQDVIDHIQERYGDYVLMRPPLNKRTIALWVSPFLLGGLALLVGWFVIKGPRNGRKKIDLSEAEEAEILRFIDATKPGKTL